MVLALRSASSLVQHHFHFLHFPGGAVESAAEAAKAVKSLQKARKLAAPVMSATALSTTASASAGKPGKVAAKVEAAPGAVPAQALAWLRTAAEACEGVMSKLDTASNAAGALQL